MNANNSLLQLEVDSKREENETEKNRNSFDSISSKVDN